MDHELDVPINQRFMGNNQLNNRNQEHVFFNDQAFDSCSGYDSDEENIENSEDSSDDESHDRIFTRRIFDARNLIYNDPDYLTDSGASESDEEEEAELLEDNPQINVEAYPLHAIIEPRQVRFRPNTFWVQFIAGVWVRLDLRHNCFYFHVHSQLYTFRILNIDEIACCLAHLYPLFSFNNPTIHLQGPNLPHALMSYLRNIRFERNNLYDMICPYPCVMSGENFHPSQLNDRPPQPMLQPLNIKLSGEKLLSVSDLQIMGKNPPAQQLVGYAHIKDILSHENYICHHLEQIQVSIFDLHLPQFACQGLFNRQINFSYKVTVPLHFCRTYNQHYICPIAMNKIVRAREVQQVLFESPLHAENFENEAQIIQRLNQLAKEEAANQLFSSKEENEQIIQKSLRRRINIRRVPLKKLKLKKPRRTSDSLQNNAPDKKDSSKNNGSKKSSSKDKLPSKFVLHPIAKEFAKVAHRHTFKLAEKFNAYLAHIPKNEQSVRCKCGLKFGKLENVSFISNKEKVRTVLLKYSLNFIEEAGDNFDYFLLDLSNLRLKYELSDKEVVLLLLYSISGNGFEKLEKALPKLVDWESTRKILDSLFSPHYEEGQNNLW